MSTFGSTEGPLESLEGMAGRKPPLWRTILRNVIVFAVAAVLLWLCFQQVGIRSVEEQIRTANFALLACALVLGYLALFFTNLWGLFVALESIGFRGSWKSFVWAVSALQLPASVQVHLSGAAFMAYLKRRHGVLVRRSASVGLLLYFVDASLLAALALPSRFLLPRPVGTWITAVAALILLYHFFTYGYYRKWWDPFWPGRLEFLLKIRDWELVRALRESRPSLYGRLFLIRAGTFSVMALSHAAALRAFGASAPVWYLSFAIPVGLFIGNLPVSFAGLGTTQLSMIFFLAPYVPKETAVAYSLVYSTSVILLRAVHGALTFRTGVNELLAKEAEPAG